MLREYASSSERSLKIAECRAQTRSHRGPCWRCFCRVSLRLAESLSAADLPACCNTIYCPLHHRQMSDLQRDKSNCDAMGIPGQNDCSMRACDAAPNPIVGTAAFVLVVPVALRGPAVAEAAPAPVSRVLPLRCHDPLNTPSSHFSELTERTICKRRFRRIEDSSVRRRSEFNSEEGENESQNVFKQSRYCLGFCRVAVTIGSAPARAEIFGTVHGIVHDPQHRPIQDAAVDLKAQHSDWVQHQKTNGDGEFDFSAVPSGRIHGHRHCGQLSTGAAECHCRVWHEPRTAFSTGVGQRHRRKQL